MDLPSRARQRPRPHSVARSPGAAFTLLLVVLCGLAGRSYAQASAPQSALPTAEAATSPASMSLPSDSPAHRRAALSSTHLPGLLLAPEWLHTHIDQAGLLVLDARSARAYQSGHIRGAINLPVDLTFGPAPRTDLLAPLNIIQGLFRMAGVSNRKRIVIYDDGEAINAARLFWALEAYGLQNVAVLNGGTPGWLARGYRLTREPGFIQPSQFIAQVNPGRLTTKLRVRMNLRRPNKPLIDVRSVEEFVGKKSESKRFGHIPGAINVPWTRNFTAVGNVKQLKSKPQLEALYSPLINKQELTTTYCNKGKQAALTYLVLRSLDYPVVSYDGSWFEWGNDPSLPITGPGDAGRPVTTRRVTKPLPPPQPGLPTSTQPSSTTN